MEKIKTEYGVLQGIIQKEFHGNGILKECMLGEVNEINTQYGQLIPQYEEDNVRRKYTNSLAFYESGKLKRICLNEQTEIKTPLGVFPVELLTFYESGNLKRIFPLNGKVTGYWTEENEYELSLESHFKFIFGDFKSKIISVYFYENRSVKSITFWPKENVVIASPIGKVEVRIGLSLYTNGTLKSIEPSKPVVVKTPIGNIKAFDENPIGLHGDLNSLSFYEDGSIKSLKTTSSSVAVIDSLGRKILYKPDLKPNLLNSEDMEIIPLQISFKAGKVIFNMNEENEFAFEKYYFLIEEYKGLQEIKCKDCSSCNACK